MMQKNTKLFFFLLFFLMVGILSSYPLLTLYGTYNPIQSLDDISSKKMASIPLDPPPRMTLSELKEIKAKEVAKEKTIADRLSDISPASGGTSVKAEPKKPDAEWTPEAQDMKVEVVLVPRRTTVISSSQDGKISDIPLENGDSFKKGDILVRYDCADLEAEAAIAGIQQNLTEKKKEGVNRLFKLDIISDVDRLSIETEDSQANAKIALYKAKLESCVIRSQFEGHVTKRLANAGEYTRTDRVLMEVASNEPLQAQFLLPSKWLRWVNKGAPIRISISETGREYSAKVSRLYGEIDPVSQSIQMVATLDDYTDMLLPGMSGQAVINVEKIKSAGIKGFLQSSGHP